MRNFSFFRLFMRMSLVKKFSLILFGLGIVYLLIEINFENNNGLQAISETFVVTVKTSVYPTSKQHPINNTIQRQLIVTTTNVEGGIEINWVNFKETPLPKTRLRKSNKCLPIANTSIAGKMGQGLLLLEHIQEYEVQAAHPDIFAGGRWAPTECQALYKVAIIIPYRDRKSHLVRLLEFLFKILKKQNLDFRFIVTEQSGDDLFNKGRIMNGAFRFAEILEVDCVIFHDVDMFPQNFGTPYECPGQPRHVGAFVSNLGYQLWYPEIVGGVLAITMAQYKKVNGYSNAYWGWGGEDDDMGKRIMANNFTIERPDQKIARFSMLKHVKRQRTAPKLIYKLLENADKRWVTDGLSETDTWKIERVILKPLYYHLFINVGDPSVEWKP